MSYDFDSIAECTSAPFIAELGGRRCTNFFPLLSRSYQDAAGQVIDADPDFLIERERCFTFIDTKSGKLNFHRTRQSSHDALKQVHIDYFHRCGDHLTHGQLSKKLFESGRAGYLLGLEHAFNHSMFKLAAIQAKHGWMRFLVVFKKSPSKKEAMRYLKAGLVFCTVKTLSSMMTTIELIQHGWNVPFVFHGPAYSFSVQGDPATRGLSEQEVEAIDRAKFLAAVAADEAGDEEDNARIAADQAAGRFPF